MGLSGLAAAATAAGNAGRRIICWCADGRSERRLRRQWLSRASAAAPHDRGTSCARSRDDERGPLAAGLASPARVLLRALDPESPQANARAYGAAFDAAFAALQERHSPIGDVCGRGMLRGVE